MMNITLPSHWCLVPIPRGKKRPVTYNWNQEENCGLPIDWTGNIGLAHAYSGTCALDIDNLEQALFHFQLTYGIDLGSLISAPDSVQIISGRPNHLKLLYRLPFPLKTKAIKFDNHDVFQFRCATRDGLTVQDVLPPSIHPDTGMPYTWGGSGDPGNPPLMPGELFQVWLELLNQEEQRRAPTVFQQDYGETNLKEVTEALYAIDPDLDREHWIFTGMAVHSVSSDLYPVWDEWSSTGAKYKGPDDTWKRWVSFSNNRSNQIGIGTLFQMAKEAGWQRKYRPKATFPPIQTIGASAPSVPPLSQQVTPEQRARDLLTRAQMIHGLDLMKEDTNRELCQLLWETEMLDVARRSVIHDEIRSRLSWTKQQLSQQIQYIKREMTITDSNPIIPDSLKDVLSEFVFVKEINQYFRPTIKQFLTPEAFRSGYCHTVGADESVTQVILQKNMIAKVDRVDYVPGMDKFLEENGVKYANLWNGIVDRGEYGDPSPWLNHFDVLGWTGDQKKRLLQFMAFTLRYPQKKINHIIVLGGPEGNGKDFLLYPLKAAMGENAKEIPGERLLSEFQDYLLGVKYLHVNETEHGDHTEAKRVVARLKPLGACPPDRLNVNPKGVKPIDVRNIVNVTMTTNERLPLKLDRGARRWYPLWTDVSIRGEDGEVREDWKRYWAWYWPWMRTHWKECVYYLINEVDLADFDPGEAPPLTDFMREIQEASTDPLADLIVEKWSEGRGLWKADMLSNQDVHNAIVMEGELMLNRYGIRRTPSLKAVAAVIAKYGIAQKFDKAVRDFGRIRVWVYRNKEEYFRMTGREVKEAYEAQMDQWERDKIRIIGGATLKNTPAS